MPIDLRTRLKLGALTALAPALAWVFTMVGPACIDCTVTGNCEDNYRELGFQLPMLLAIGASSLGLGAAALSADPARPSVISRGAVLLAFVPAWLVTAAVLVPFLGDRGDPPGPAFAAMIGFVYALVGAMQLLVFLTLLHLRAASADPLARFRRALMSWIAGVAGVQLLIGGWQRLSDPPTCEKVGLAPLEPMRIFGVDIGWLLLAACVGIVIVATRRRSAAPLPEHHSGADRPPARPEAPRKPLSS